MPRPTPVNTAPPASPRRDGATAASTVGAARTISTPPARPDARRQARNQANDGGRAQAKKVALASTIMARSSVAAPVRRPKRCASSAPAR